MAQRKITADYLDNYNTIILTQPLTKGRYIQEVYSKTNRGWVLNYISNSAYHICPYDGNFRNCKDCGVDEEDFDIKFCTKKQQVFRPAALIERIRSCQDAKLEVKFMD